MSDNDRSDHLSAIRGMGCSVFRDSSKDARESTGTIDTNYLALKNSTIAIFTSQLFQLLMRAASKTK